MYFVDLIYDNEKICVNFGFLLWGILFKYFCVCMNGNYIFVILFVVCKVFRKWVMI